MHRNTTQAKQKGFKVWQMILTVAVMGLVMRTALGTLPVPEPGYTQAHRTVVHPPLRYEERLFNYQQQNQRPTQNETVVEVLPFNLQGEVPGPLLASIMQRYMPESTDDQATDLRNTLPPGADPRMIVILPEEQEPLF